VYISPTLPVAVSQNAAPIGVSTGASTAIEPTGYTIQVDCMHCDNTAIDSLKE